MRGRLAWRLPAWRPCRRSRTCFWRRRAATLTCLLRLWLLHYIYLIAQVYGWSPQQRNSFATRKSVGDGVGGYADHHGICVIILHSGAISESDGRLRGAQVLCGLLLSIVFVQSHNGMEVYSGCKDFVTAQVSYINYAS